MISQNIESIYSPIYSNSLGELENFIMYDLAGDTGETRPQGADSMHMEEVLFY
jgi:hypothetical protein